MRFVVPFLRLRMNGAGLWCLQMTRNLFDQYNHYENRLTHALLCAFSFDRHLLARFLKRYAKGLRFDCRILKVAEQTFPGIPEPTIDLEIKKSLPDGIIFEDDQHSDEGQKLALIIESKIASPLTNDQLQRHTNGFRARGYTVSGLAITADTFKANLPEGWSTDCLREISVSALLANMLKINAHL